MTIASASRGRNTYTASGANNDFDYGFIVFLDTHLEVSVVSPLGVTYDLDLSTDGTSDDFTVDGVGNGTGGTVTLLNNSQAWMTGGFLTVDYEIIILRTVPLTQLANLRGEGGYVPETNEQEMDLITMALQQLYDEFVAAGIGTGTTIKSSGLITVDGGTSALLSDEPTIALTGTGNSYDVLKGDGTYAADARVLQIVIDGAGSVLDTSKIQDFYFPFSCTILGVVLLADQSGSVVLNIKKDTYANYPPSTSIVASAPPTISSATKSKDTTLTGWTTAIAADTTLRVSVTSATTITRVTLAIHLRKN